MFRVYHILGTVIGDAQTIDECMRMVRTMIPVSRKRKSIAHSILNKLAASKRGTVDYIRFDRSSVMIVKL